MELWYLKIHISKPCRLTSRSIAYPTMFITFSVKLFKTKPICIFKLKKSQTTEIKKKKKKSQLWLLYEQICLKNYYKPFSLQMLKHICQGSLPEYSSLSFSWKHISFALSSMDKM